MASRHLKTLMLKELKQILADKSVLLVAFFLPLMLVVIYGSGIRMDVKPVSVALVSSKLDDVIVREVAFALAGSDYFELTTLNNQAQAQELLIKHEISAYLMLPNNLSQSMYHQPVDIMITINGADAQQASIARSYLEAVLLSGPTQKGLSRQITYLATAPAINQAQSLSQAHALQTNQINPQSATNFRFNVTELTGGQAPSTTTTTTLPTSTQVTGHAYEPVQLTTRNWFNESNESTWYLMAGQLIGIITLMSSFMSSIVIAREFERGTMAGLLATNATAGELFIAKLVPYYVLSCLGAALAILTTLICYELPFRGSALLYLITLAVYLYVSVLIGLIISAVTQNQFLSSEYAIILSFLPSILLSGAIFDLRSIPPIIGAIAHLFPPTYAVESSKICILSGGSTDTILSNLAILTLFAAGGTLLCYRVLKRHFTRYVPAPVPQAAAANAAPAKPAPVNQGEEL